MSPQHSNSFKRKRPQTPSRRPRVDVACRDGRQPRLLFTASVAAFVFLVADAASAGGVSSKERLANPLADSSVSVTGVLPPVVFGKVQIAANSQQASPDDLTLSRRKEDKKRRHPLHQRKAPTRIAGHASSPVKTAVLPAGTALGVNANTTGIRSAPSPAQDARYRSPPSQSQEEISANVQADPHTAQPPMQPEVSASVDGSDMDQLDLALGQRQTFSDQPLGQGQIYSDLRSLQSSIAETQRSVANITTRYSTQSDKLNISQTEISQNLFFDEGASRLQPGVQYVAYMPKTGYGVTQYSAGFDGNYRISDSSAVAGDFWLNTVASGAQPSDVIPTYDVFLTLWPSDFIRVDLDSKREIFDNIASLRSGIIAESAIASVDFTPSDDLRLTLRGGNSYYSDSNQRQSADAEAVWRIQTLPTIEIGLRASGFRFSQQLNNGYFNPNNYISGEAMFQIQSALSDNLSVEFDASGGIESADPGGTKPLVKSSLQANYKLGDNWSLEGSVAYFSSRESNSSGFARTSVNLGLHYKF